MKADTAEMAQRGQITLPKNLRDRYGLKTGQEFAILDIGGAFLFSPKTTQVDTICDQIRDAMLDSGATVEEMLSELRAMRESDSNGA